MELHNYGCMLLATATCSRASVCQSSITLDQILPAGHSSMKVAVMPYPQPCETASLLCERGVDPGIAADLARCYNGCVRDSMLNAHRSCLELKAQSTERLLAGCNEPGAVAHAVLTGKYTTSELHTALSSEPSSEPALISRIAHHHALQYLQKDHLAHWQAINHVYCGTMALLEKGVCESSAYDIFHLLKLMQLNTLCSSQSEGPGTKVLPAPKATPKCVIRPCAVMCGSSGIMVKDSYFLFGMLDNLLQEVKGVEVCSDNALRQALAARHPTLQKEVIAAAVAFRKDFCVNSNKNICLSPF